MAAVVDVALGVLAVEVEVAIEVWDDCCYWLMQQGKTCALWRAASITSHSVFQVGLDPKDAR